MKLTTILSQARSGEVKALSDKDKTDRVLITYINLGLIALYKKFSISTEEAILALKDGVTLYELNSTDTNVTVGGQPMRDDDVLTTISCYDEQGDSVPINDSDEPLGIFTPSYDTIQVPYSSTGEYLSVIYRRNPILLDPEALTDATTEALNDDTVTTRLPLQLLEPMLHYIGYRAHGSVNGSIKDENNTHYMRFVASCRAIEKDGVMNLEGMPSRDVEEKGFI